MRASILSVLFLMMFVHTIGQDMPAGFPKSEWRGLVPLKSKRSDVEKILNVPLNQGCSDCIYETAFERVHVFYSKAPCKGGVVNGWNVPKEPVISITVYPLKGPRFSLGDLKEGDVPLNYAHDSFVLQQKGVAYTLDPMTNAILRVSFLPVQADNCLRCAGYPAYNPVGSIYTPDSSFGEKEALENLDVLVAEAGEKPVGVMTYVVVYAGMDLSEQRYGELLKKYDEYLYKKRLASPEKIRLIRGGKRDRLTISVYNLAKGMPPPVPSPDYPSAF